MVRVRPKDGGILKIPATRGKRSWGIFELSVVGFVDYAHAAFSELFEDPVMRNRLSDHEIG
jgi:hypothetical protein